MPTYVYRCPVHGEFEVEQRITDPPLARCGRQVPHLDLWTGERVLGQCSEPAFRLIAGKTTFVLRGSGWAKDGYGR